MNQRFEKRFPVPLRECHLFVTPDGGECNLSERSQTKVGKAAALQGSCTLHQFFSVGVDTEPQASTPSPTGLAISRM